MQEARGVAGMTASAQKHIEVTTGAGATLRRMLADAGAMAGKRSTERANTSKLFSKSCNATINATQTLLRSSNQHCAQQIRCRRLAL